MLHVTDHVLPPPVAPRFLPGGPPARLTSGEPDPYAWMRDRDLTATVLAAEESVCWRRDGHTYFTRTIPGREFEQFCRAGAGGDQVLLDTNLLLDDPGCAGAYV